MRLTTTRIGTGTVTTLVCALVATLLAPPATAQFSGAPEKATLQLAESATAYVPGSTAQILAIATVDEGWHIQSNTPTFDYLIPTELELELPEGFGVTGVDYPAHGLWATEFEETPLAVYEGEVYVLASIAVPLDAPTGPVAVTAHLQYQACDDRQCLPPTGAVAEVVLSIGSDGGPVNEALFEAAREAGEEASPGVSPDGAAAGTGDPLSPGAFVGFLLFGVLGGLILNAMPCVLPVLSLKLFALVEGASKGRAATQRGALATAAGIITSFWALALAAVVARGAGQLIGWGVQFQNPGFVTVLLIIVVLFCLNLWGLFEIPLPRRLAMAASGGSNEGLAGHFGTGLFATLMATPCSAPFLGTAVGFALAQSGAVIFAVFTAIGVGMAVPYLLFAAAPGALSWLPRPGPWMVKLKVVMGFLLAGAGVWLLYVLAAQLPSETLAFIEIGILVMALFVWLSSGTGSSAGRWARGGVLAAIAAVLWLSLSGPPPAANGNVTVSQGLIDWTPFDRDRAETLSRNGRLVFVDVTADWCFTCKANERLVLETREVSDAFDAYDVIAMKADWTNRSDDIARYLADYGRYSVPFYMLYRPGAEPRLFPELLRKKEILAALAR